MNMCMSYNATLRLTDDLSKLHNVPVKQWIKDREVFKFWGGNLDKLQRVYDLWSDYQGEMLHMFSVIVGHSRTPAPELPFSGQIAHLNDALPSCFRLSGSEVAALKANLVTLVGRTLIEFIPSLTPFSKVVSKHIRHGYSAEMSKKSDVAVLDALLKNEAKHKDMLDIMSTLQDYLGEDYPDDKPVLSGGDQLTCE